MSRFDSLLVEIRSRDDFVPACPLCSFLQRPDAMPDIITAPSILRSKRIFYDGERKVPMWSYRIVGCCPWSDLPDWHEGAAAAAARWREARLVPHDVPAVANRQASTLRKLETAGMEPCAPPPAVPASASERWEDEAEQRRLGL